MGFLLGIIRAEVDSALERIDQEGVVLLYIIQEQVAQEIGYDRQRDLENPSCSVFCSHGAGFPVPWDEVPNYIHCK